MVFSLENSLHHLYPPLGGILPHERTFLPLRRYSLRRVFSLRDDTLLRMISLKGDDD